MALVYSLFKFQTSQCMISNSTVVGNKTAQTLITHCYMFLLSFDWSISDNDSPSKCNGRYILSIYMCKEESKYVFDI